MHTLLHIYGPIAIHSYGLMIAIGLLAFIYLCRRDPRFKALALAPSFSSILMVGIAAALLGGRTLYFYTYPHNYHGLTSFFAFYEGGYSILGAVIGVLAIVPAYLRYLKIPILPFLDLIGTYAPLLQSISRIGCFLAGCCYGIPTSQPWGIIYTDTQSVAPLHVCLHPTQLYSATLMLLIFAFQYFIGRRLFTKAGQMLWSYLLLASLSRFIVDFWRGDRLLDSVLISENQQVAIAIFGVALIGMCITTFTSSLRRP